MGSITQKFPVPPSVTRPRNFSSERSVARNPNAIPVSKRLCLEYLKSKKLKRTARIYSGRELLDILSGFRAGDLNLFNL